MGSEILSTDHRETEQIDPHHRRRRNLTEDDVKAIIKALREDTTGHICRFGDLDPKVVSESTLFYQNFNSIIGESGKIIWKTVLTCGVAGFIVIIGMGVVAKIKEITGK